MGRIDEPPELQQEIVTDNEELERLKRQKHTDFLINEQILKNNLKIKKKKVIRKMN